MADPVDGQIAALIALGEKLDLQTQAIQSESDARVRKTDELSLLVKELETQQKVQKRQNWFLLFGVVCLLIFGGINVYNTTVAQHSAKTVSDTNQLLLSCFDPNSQCGKQNATEQARQRQQSYVIASCQRANPVDLEQTPAQNEKKLLACINKYYPDLALPPVAK